MSDLNISDVLPKLRVKLQHGTALNTNNFALIWILVAFKGNINTMNLLCDVGPLRAKGGELPQQLIDYIWKSLHVSFLRADDENFSTQKTIKSNAQHTQSAAELMSDVRVGNQSEIL